MAEALLKKLRRLEGNMTCPNCGTEASRGVGFGHVCVKYKTFICDMCKASHQAISHRVKSVSMSTWTLEEVQELMQERGGGNEVCRQTILASAPPFGKKYNGGSRPKQGDKIDIFKQFVMDAYEYGKFAGSAPTPMANDERQTQSQQLGGPSPSNDLLGGPLGSSTETFDAFSASNSVSSGNNFDPFGNGSNDSFIPTVPKSQDFDSFNGTADIFGTGATLSTPAQPQTFDLFSSGSSAPAFAPSKSSSDPFSSAPPLNSQPMGATVGAHLTSMSQPTFSAMGAAPSTQRAAVMTGGPHQAPQQQAFVPSAPGSSSMSGQHSPRMGGGPMGGGSMGMGSAMGGGSMGGGSMGMGSAMGGGPMSMGGGPMGMGGGPMGMGGGPMGMGGGPMGMGGGPMGMGGGPMGMGGGSMGMGGGPMGGPVGMGSAMGGMKPPPQGSMGMGMGMGMGMSQSGFQQGNVLNGATSTISQPKTGMFSPGGAATKLSSSSSSSTRGSNLTGSSLLNDDLASSLASTLNANSGSGSQNKRSSIVSDHHFDFVKNEMKR